MDEQPTPNGDELILTPLDNGIVDPVPDEDKVYQGQFGGAPRAACRTHELIVLEQCTVEAGWFVAGALLKGPSGSPRWVQGWEQRDRDGQPQDPESLWSSVQEHEGGNGISDEAAFLWVAPEDAEEAIRQLEPLIRQRTSLLSKWDSPTPKPEPQGATAATAGALAEPGREDTPAPLEPLPFDVAQVLSWRLLSELVRRHPDRLWLQRRSPVDIYDCLAVVTLAIPHQPLLYVNRLGNHALVVPTDMVLPWTSVYGQEPCALDSRSLPYEWLVERERELGLTPPSGGLPASTPSSLAVRWIAQFLSMQLGARQQWYAWSGSVHEGMPAVTEWARQQPELTGTGSVWYLGRDYLNGAEIVVTLDGSVWSDDGRIWALPSLHLHGHCISELVVQVAGPLLP